MLAIALSGFARWPPKRSGRACWGCCSARRCTRSRSSWRCFCCGLGIGSGMGAYAEPNSSATRARALGWCQLLLAGGIAWTAYSLGASLPYWPVNPSISSNIWFNFQLDLDRAFLGAVAADATVGRELSAGARRRLRRKNKIPRQIVRGRLCRQHPGRDRWSAGRQPDPDRLDRIAARGADSYRGVDDRRGLFLPGGEARRGRASLLGV